MPIAAIPDVFSRDQWSETSLGTSCCASDRDDAKVEVVVVKMIIAAALAAGVARTAVSPADARQGCGPGHHRGPYGGCRINRDRMMARPGVLVVDRFHHGRGYWDGHRYWQHRARWHNGSRYR
jgi:hypothetical protein